MAKKLREYKRKELRCVVVEDFETNNIFTIYNQEEIKSALEKYSEWEVTKVYNPTQEQKNKLWEMSSSTKDDKIDVGLKGEDMIIHAIPMLTDIEVDLTIEEDKEELKSIIADGDSVFNSVAYEVNEILMEITNDYIKNLKVISKLPNELLDELVKGNLNG